MICNATDHRRRSFMPLVAFEQSQQAQAFMLRAEVVDEPYREHPRLQGLALTAQISRLSGRAAQTSAKGPVKPFDENGNHLFVSRCSAPLNPRDEALIELGDVQPGKDIAEGIVRWNSIRQIQKGTQPVCIRFTPLLHFREPLVSADRRQDGDGDDVDQFAPFVLIVSTRIRQLREVVKYRWSFCFVCFYGGHCEIIFIDSRSHFSRWIYLL